MHVTPTRPLLAEPAALGLPTLFQVAWALAGVVTIPIVKATVPRHSTVAIPARAKRPDRYHRTCAAIRRSAL